MPIDFTELGNVDRPGYGLQGLARALARKSRGWKTVYWSGFGPDGQKDMIFADATTNRKWLVSCKDNSVSQASVAAADLPNINNILLQHKCDSFLLITTTGPTQGAKNLIDALNGVELVTGGTIASEIWDKHKLMDMLAEPNCRAIAKLYFPKSSGDLGNADLLSSTDFLTVLENIAAQDSDPLELFKILIDEIDSPAIKLTIAEFVLEDLSPGQEHLLDLLTGFDSDELEILTGSLSEDFKDALGQFLWTESTQVGIDHPVEEISNGGYIEEICLEECSLKLNEQGKIELHAEVSISIDTCPGVKGVGHCEINENGYTGADWTFHIDNSDW